MPSLSVCMIVRNEQEQLPGCLESLQGLAEQIIIVDTGSDDGTVEVAKAAGAEVYHFKWIDDFSAARNESLKHAVGDWRLWLDADERVDLSTARILQKLPKRAAKPTFYQVHLRSHQSGDDYVSMSMSHRLISHHGQFQFSGRIHEQVYPSVIKLGGVEKKSGLILDHYGYALSEEEMAKKLERNRPLLEAMLLEEDNRTYALYTLGQNYAMAQDFERALELYEQALQEGGFSGLSLVPLYNNLAEVSIKLGRFDEAGEYINDSILIAPDQTAGHFMLYRLCQTKRDGEGQIQALEKVLEISRNRVRGKTGAVAQDVVIAPAHILLALAKLHLAKGDFPAAEAAIKEPLEEAVEREISEEIYLRALAGQGRWGDVVTTIEQGDADTRSRF
ncbi:MAG: glycosyltransferase, partial [Candidatus Marinimicrobia bacterium]|nr:glycosyltransferase [Candidatus Neomarinimicrobiota bacterium]